MSRIRTTNERHKRHEIAASRHRALSVPSIVPIPEPARVTPPKAPRGEAS